MRCDTQYAFKQAHDAIKNKILILCKITRINYACNVIGNAIVVGKVNFFIDV